MKEIETQNASELMIAVKSSDADRLQKVQQLLKGDTDINADYALSQSNILCHLDFSKYEDVKIFELLLENGANPDLRDKQKDAPLAAILSNRIQHTAKTGDDIYMQAILVLLSHMEDVYSQESEFHRIAFHPHHFQKLAPLTKFLLNFGFNFPENFSASHQDQVINFTFDDEGNNIEILETATTASSVSIANIYAYGNVNPKKEVEVMLGSAGKELNLGYLDEILANVRSNLTCLDDYLHKDIHFLNLALGKGNFRPIIKLAAEEGRDISDFLLKEYKDTGRAIAQNSLSSNNQESQKAILYFQYWRQFPDGFTRVIEWAKNELKRSKLEDDMGVIHHRVSSGSAVDPEQEERFTPETYKEFLDFGVNVRALATLPEKPSQNGVCLEGIHEKKPPPGRSK